jgi:hypothetical protein
VDLHCKMHVALLKHEVPNRTLARWRKAGNVVNMRRACEVQSVELSLRHAHVAAAALGKRFALHSWRCTDVVARQRFHMRNARNLSHH